MTVAQQTMRALVFTGPGAMELRDVATPGARDGWVPVTVRASGICGSELHGFRSVGFRRPPLVMGHEFAGETPDGRRVVVNPLLSCGECDLCHRGKPELCRRRELLGVHLAGGFAERVTVPAGAVHVIPDEMTWETAALIEPLANAVHAWRQVEQGGIGRVAVIGAGAIGLVSLLVAAHEQLGEVTVVDRSGFRLVLAGRLGAAVCAEELEGEYDVVVDAVGSAQTRASAVEHVRPGGTSVWLGLAEAAAGFDGNGLVRGEKRVVGSFAYSPEDFADAVRLAASLDLGWATAIDMEDSQRIFMELAGGAQDPVKAVIRL
ncbi:alcohol dehydrogenase catalytic domain-containing protein [Nocardioides panacis]|uniref:Alcohol dehydrogenase catalytic domain-containing protein n=1 Tax=Nocardioides panacis TaxID=2849501 RepID=A0A975SZ37_9ACTN|nr:alcohol dehydrogenase catalytic domain-containing protein [Nocardioides panacis]QWZ08609.1 alcohol dehydrogenase catalytic domain-containing protein [Nocardioides panacis]